jgi:hypothetical protein
MVRNTITRLGNTKSMVDNMTTYVPEQAWEEPITTRQNDISCYGAQWAQCYGTPQIYNAKILVALLPTSWSLSSALCRLHPPSLMRGILYGYLFKRGCKCPFYFLHKHVYLFMYLVCSFPPFKNHLKKNYFQNLYFNFFGKVYISLAIVSLVYTVRLSTGVVMVVSSLYLKCCNWEGMGNP